jgi:ATP:ADP antiporter, AAA family
MSPETPVTTRDPRPAPDAVEGARKTIVERLLSPIADIHHGEVATALLLTLLMFFILGAYYLLKTAREVFILSQGGAEVKSYSAAGQAMLLLFLVPAYGQVASKVNRERLVTWVTLFFASNVLLFAAAYGFGLRIGIPYFLWVGIFNVMVIAQFWAFANDLYTQDQGKRLFPLIGVGSSLGAWIGSLRAGYLVEAFGPQRLLIAGGILLTVCVVLSRVVDRITRRESREDAKRADERIAGGKNGFSMIVSDPYLGLIALLVIFLNVVNTSGEYLFGRYVVDSANATFGTGPEGQAAREQFIGQAYSTFFSYVNLIGFLLQLFVVSRVFKLLGVGRSLFVHPIVALAGYVLMLRAPSLDLMRAVKIADNSIDYSLGNTTKQALWLPTSREAKYKAKQAVDSFCQRAGDVLQAGLVWISESAALAVPAFAAIVIVLTGGWLTVVVGLNRRLRAQAKEQVAAASL